MSVERLFFGQKYVVFWAKHLISILGIRFGGSRDEILTFGIAIRVITPPYSQLLFQISSRGSSGCGTSSVGRFGHGGFSHIIQCSLKVWWDMTCSNKFIINQWQGELWWRDQAETNKPPRCHFKTKFHRGWPSPLLSQMHLLISVHYSTRSYGNTFLKSASREKSREVNPRPPPDLPLAR